MDAVCVGSDQRVLADSAEQFGDEKRLILIGHAHYTEKRVKLDADRMTYYTGEERILAEGNVVGRTNTGTRFAGPRANYLRAAAGIRATSRLEADSRPHVWLSPKDAGGAGKDTVSLEADRVISENDSLVYAKGRVIIDRVDLVATADSAAMDNGAEIARLFYSPKIVGRGERHFTLVGNVIEAWSRQRELQRVKSGGAAKATSDDITLTADTIDLRLRGQKLDRAFAWGGKRALAHAKERDITADSIDILMPNQSIREMRAVRNALAESEPDSLKIVSKQKDWLRGDTIVARFDSVATGDTVNKPAVRQITATGTATSTAKSFYQVAPGARSQGHDHPERELRHRPPDHRRLSRSTGTDRAGEGEGRRVSISRRCRTAARCGPGRTPPTRPRRRRRRPRGRNRERPPQRVSPRTRPGDRRAIRRRRPLHGVDAARARARRRPAG